MVNATEGMSGSLVVGGTAIALLSGMDLSWSRSVSEWASMGETATSDVLLGVRKHKGTVHKAFIDWSYKAFFNINSGTFLVGTICPIGGGAETLAGSMAVTGGKLTNMKQDTEAAVIEDMDFVFFNVTQVG